MPRYSLHSSVVGRVWEEEQPKQRAPYTRGRKSSQSTEHGILEHDERMLEHVC